MFYKGGCGVPPMRCGADCVNGKIVYLLLEAGDSKK